MLRFLTAVGASLAVLISGLAAPVAGPGEAPQIAQISGDPNKPRRHYRIRRPARLAPVLSRPPRKRARSAVCASRQPKARKSTRVER